MKNRPKLLRNFLFAASMCAALVPRAHASGDPIFDLVAAIERKDLSVVKDLLGRGMGADTTDQAGNTLLMTASRVGAKDIVLYLIGAGANVNARNGFGDTALMYAALSGQTEICKILLDHNAEFDHDGWNPLIYAAGGGHDDIVLMLLALDCDIDAASANGTSALMMAAQGGHTKTVKLLLEHKADFTLINDAGKTAMSWAAARKHSDIVALLKAAGAKR
jgi:ankyrin repeat protein